MEKDKVRIRRSLYIKTFALIVVWIAMGMSHSMVPATLPDIRERLGIDTEEISRLLALGGIGGLVGAPLGSVSDRYSRKVDAIMSFGLVVGALTIATRCLTTNLVLFTLNLFVDGVSWTCLNAVGNAALIDLWGDKVGTPMHALHFGYPIGAMIGPLIAYPFVSDVIETNTTDNNTTTAQPLQPFDLNFDDDSEIEIAFAIVGCFIGILAVLFAFFQIYMPSSKIASFHNKSGYKWRDVFSPSNWAGGDTKFGVVMTTLMMLFYSLHVITIKASSTFYPSYAVDQLDYTPQQATLFSSITSFAGTMGRALSIIFAKFVPIDIMLFTEVYGEVFFAVLTLLWGLSDKLSFLIFSCLFILFREPVWPSGYTWTNQFISLQAIVVGLSDMAVKLVDSLFSWLLGYLYTYTVPESLFYNTVCAGIVLCVLLVVMYIVGRRHGKINRQLETDMLKSDGEISYSNENNEMTKF